MAKTLANLSAQTRTYLDESITADWTDAEVTREVNAKYLETYSAVVSVFEDYYSEKTTASTVADQQEYTLPTDLYKLRRVEINYDITNSSTATRRALPVSLDAVLRDLGGLNSITPYRSPAYYLRGTKIGFLPIPNAAGTNAITYWYIKNISELSASSDAIDIPFPDRYGQLISLGAAGTLMRKGQQEEVASRQYLSDFAAGLERMKMELEDRIADDAKGITDTLGEDVDFSAPFWG